MQKIVLTNQNYDDFISESQDVTYAQLSILITNSKLEAGRKYRITDYATAYNIFDGGTNTVIGARLGTVEPLIVIATGESTLAKEAYSELYPQDIIYYNPYALAVDRAAFIAAGDVGYIDSGDVVPNFKGVIEFRHDTKQNVSTWYDFRNIKFRRWAVDAVAYDGDTDYIKNDVCKSGVDGKIYKCLTDTTGEGDPTVNTADWILWWDITVDAYISWTTDNTKFSIGNITTTNLVFVPATYEDVYTFGDWYNHVNDVTIGHNSLTLLIDYGYNTTLNNIVFKTTDDLYTCYLNEIGDLSYNNTIGNGSNFNTIGNGFSDNTIGNDFSENTIGDYFYENTIENDFSDNTIGKDFSESTIGNDFSDNTIGNDFSSNTIGNDFSDNTIGNYFYSNTIGNGFSSNIIGNAFNSNTIGDSFSYNTIGNKFSSGTIGNEFLRNTIGNDFYRGTIGDGFSFNIIGNKSKVSAGIYCEGNSIGDFNDKVTLGNECSGISIGEKNGTITLGAANTNISIGNGNHTITTGDNCTNLTFQNGCTFSRNTEVNGLQNCLFESGTSISAVSFGTATHIKAAYNTTVFMNATPAVKLSYFNNRNELIVNGVNT